ncbi:MAG: hypothetical protein GY906_15305, partial [bacterium]|nr:hypothetical protein [bacterium]
MTKVFEEIVDLVKDSLVQVYGWNRSVLELSVLVENPETDVSGTLTFTDVRHFCLPSATKAARFEMRLAGDLPEHFWESVSVSRRSFKADQPFYLFAD